MIVRTYVVNPWTQNYPDFVRTTRCTANYACLCDYGLGVNRRGVVLRRTRRSAHIPEVKPVDVRNESATADWRPTRVTTLLGAGGAYPFLERTDAHHEFFRFFQMM